MLETFDQVAKLIVSGSDRFFTIVWLAIGLCPWGRLRTLLYIAWLAMSVALIIWMFVPYVWYIMRVEINTEDADNWPEYVDYHHTHDAYNLLLSLSHYKRSDSVNWKIEGF